MHGLVAADQIVEMLGEPFGGAAQVRGVEAERVVRFGENRDLVDVVTGAFIGEKLAERAFAPGQPVPLLSLSSHLGGTKWKSDHGGSFPPGHLPVS